MANFTANVGWGQIKSLLGSTALRQEQFTAQMAMQTMLQLHIAIGATLCCTSCRCSGERMEYEMGGSPANSSKWRPSNRSKVAPLMASVLGPHGLMSVRCFVACMSQGQGQMQSAVLHADCCPHRRAWGISKCRLSW